MSTGCHSSSQRRLYSAGRRLLRFVGWRLQGVSSGRLLVRPAGSQSRWRRRHGAGSTRVRPRRHRRDEGHAARPKRVSAAAAAAGIAATAAADAAHATTAATTAVTARGERSGGDCYGNGSGGAGDRGDGGNGGGSAEGDDGDGDGRGAAFVQRARRPSRETGPRL